MGMNLNPVLLNAAVLCCCLVVVLVLFADALMSAVALLEFRALSILSFGLICFLAGLAFVLVAF